MKIRLISTFWGGGHTHTFLRVCLPSLLAPGNLPQLTQNHQVKLCITTTSESRKILESSVLFRRLFDLVQVIFVEFSEEGIEDINYGSHGKFWNQELEVARHTCEAIIFIIPDVIYADSTLSRWGWLLENGAGAIYTPGPQVVLETVLPEIEAVCNHKDANGILNYSKTELQNLILLHLHPWHAIMSSESSYRPHHPELDIRIVKGEGLIWREYSTHPHALVPSLFGRLNKLNPDDHLGLIAFEDCSIASVEPLLKRAPTHYVGWPLNEYRLTTLGHWFSQWGGLACEKVSSHPFFISLSDSKDVGRSDSMRKKAAINSGARYRHQLISGAKTTCFIEFLYRHGFSKTAFWYSLAVIYIPLRNKLKFKGGELATLLVPEDQAFNGDIEKILLSVIKEKNSKKFFEILENHIVNSESTKKLEECMITNGKFLTHAPFRIIPIKKIFLGGSDESRPSLPQADWGEIKDTPSSDNGFQLAPYKGTFVVTDWASSKARRVCFHAFQVPFLELLINIFYPAYFKPELLNIARVRFYRIREYKQRIFVEVRNLLRRFALMTESLPIIGFFGHQLFVLFVYANKNGIGNTIRKLRDKFYNLFPRSRSAVTIIKSLHFKVNKFIDICRVYGFSEAILKLRQHLLVRKEFKKTDANIAINGIVENSFKVLTKDALQRLDELRIANGLRTAGIILSEYTLRLGVPAHPALGLILQKLNNVSKNFSEENIYLLAAFRKLFLDYPQSSALQIELVALLIENREYDEAILNLKQAYSSINNIIDDNEKIQYRKICSQLAAILLQITENKGIDIALQNMLSGPTKSYWDISSQIRGEDIAYTSQVMNAFHYEQIWWPFLNSPRDLRAVQLQDYKC